MSTRRWIIAVAILAVWFSLLVSRERLHALSREHMYRSSLARIAADRGLPGGRYRPTPLSAWHLERARRRHEEADLVESLCLTVPLVAGLVAAAAPLVASLHQRRRGPARLAPQE